MSHKNKIKYYFNIRAEDYYEHNYQRGPNNSYFYPELFIRHQYILEMINDIDIGGKRALDIGCGSGKMAADLAKKGFKVFCIDLSYEMIKKSSQLVSQKLDDEDERAHFCLGDIEALPFQEEYFDVVIAAGVIEYLEKDAYALKEIKRVLRPGGVMILSVRNGANVTRVLFHTRNLISKIPILNTFVDWTIDVIRLILNKPRERKPIYRTHVPWVFSRALQNHGFKKEDFAFYRFAPFPEWAEKTFPGIIVPMSKKMEVFSKTLLGYMANGYLIKTRKMNRQSW